MKFSDKELDEKIKEITEEYGICANGLEGYRGTRTKLCSDFRDQVRTCLHLLGSICAGKYEYSSYYMKHVAEKWGEKNQEEYPSMGLVSYVSNGAFIVAAIIRGHKFHENGPNAFFLFEENDVNPLAESVGYGL